MNSADLCKLESRLLVLQINCQQATINPQCGLGNFFLLVRTYKDSAMSDMCNQALNYPDIIIERCLNSMSHSRGEAE